MKEVKKGKKWLLPVILAAVVLLIAGAVAAFFLLQPQQTQQPQEQAEGVTSKLYWNLDREKNLDPETGLSVREPNEQGLFLVRFLVDGEIRELQVADKQLVNYIDLLPVMGLVFDDSGVAIDAVEAKTVAMEVARNFFVMKQEAGVLTINSSLAANGVNIQLNLGEGASIYDVSPDAVEYGRVDTCNVLDEVTVYGDQDGNVTHVFIINRGTEAGVYLREKQMYDSSAGGTTRVPDKDGVYTVEFAHKGEIVSLKCKDKKLVNAIDKASSPQHIMGLVFDDEGYIEKTVTTNQALRGKLLADNFTITAINGNVLELEKKLYNAKDLGKTVTTTMTADTEIYFGENECVAEFMGQKVENLQVGDRIICYSDMDNQAMLIYVTRRMQDYPIYFNVSQKYDSEKGETTRVPENGWYVFEMTGEGKTRTLKTKDKALASFIDSISSKTMGVKLSGSTIVDACHMNCVVGNRQPGEGRFVTGFASNIVTIFSSAFTSSGNYMMSANAQIMDVTGDYGIKPGTQIKTLRDGDRLSFWIDVDGNLAGATVTQRYYEKTKLYYNLGRTYNATLQETKRVPDADGYYVFQMLCEDKEVTVKTKSKDMASYIDKDSSRFVALQVSKDGIVKEAHKHVSAVKYGRRHMSGVYYNGTNPDGTIKYYSFDSEGKRVDTTSTYRLASDCKIYNYSTTFISHRGEKTKLQKGDQIQAFSSYKGKEVKIMIVKAREFESKLYYTVSQQYNSTTMETKRVPAEDGYYYTELLVDGQVKTFKTKDKNVMSQVDSNANGFGMTVKGDVIQQAFPAGSIKGIQGTSGSYYDIMKISGNQLTLTRNRPGTSARGTTREVPLAKNYKVYDVSKTAGQFGETATIGLGDRVVSYVNDDGKIVAIFIVNKHTRVGGHVSVCDHCGKEVFWEHFGGTIYADEGHYYLPYTKESGYSQKTIGYSREQLAADETLKQYEIVLDLNGQTYVAQTRIALVYSTFTIMDSVGTGKIIGTGSGRSGGVVMLSSAGDATLNIYGGTMTNDEASEGHGNGGAIYNNKGTVNIYGGTITGCKGTYGGAVYSTGTLNIYGGNFTGNSATYGGNLYMTADGILNVQGGKFENGDAPTGGNIYAVATKQTEGEQDLVSVTLNNTRITGGDVVFENPNARPGAKLLVENSQVEKLSAADVQVALVGKLSGLMNLSGSARLMLTGLDTESRLQVAADGIFTGEYENIAQYLPCFQPAVAGMEVKQEGNALSCTIGQVSLTENLSLNGENAICPVCQTLVTWTPVTQADFGENGIGQITTNGIHYYLAEDITYTGTSGFLTAPGSGKTACLHLNGKNLTCTQARAIGGYPGVMNVMGSGTVSGNYENADGRNYASTIQINTNKSVGAIHLWSGTYTQAAGNQQKTVMSSPVNGGQIIVHPDATVVAVDSPYAYYGGRSSAADTRFAVLGGTVQGGIYMENVNTEKGFAAYLEIAGGSVSGDILVGKINDVTLSGNVTLGGTLDLTSGTKLTLGDLTMATPVSVKANGIFTQPTDQAETYKRFFTAAVGYEAVSVQENALFTQEKPAAGYTDDLSFTGETAYCPVCEKNVQWTALTQAQHSEGFGEAADGGHYYLAEDINANSSSSFLSGPARKSGVPYVACFHLNGHNLTNNGGAAIGGNSGILNVMGSGTVKGNRSASDKNYAATVQINTTAETGVVNLYSGTYANVAGNSQKAVVSINNNGGSINIYEDVTVAAAAGGNAICVGSSKQNHSGMIIYGGNIQGGVTALDRYGEKETHLSILGGNIAGDVTVGKLSSFTLAGAPTIGGVLDLTSGMKVTIGDLTASLISVKAYGIFTEADPQIGNYQNCFAPAEGFLPITQRDNGLHTDNFNSFDNKALTFAEGTTDAACPMCGGTVTWTPITGAEANVRLTAGHYYLPADVTVNAADNGKDAYLTMSEALGESVCLHLNGHNLTVTGNRAIITAPGTLNIMGEGTVSGEKGTASGGAIHVNSADAGATVNLLGGTYTKSAADQVSSILYIGSNGGSINLYNSAVVDATDRTAEAGTAVMLVGSEGKEAVFTMYGGQIKNGRAEERGGNVSASTGFAIFRMKDGIVSGGQAGTNGGNIYGATGATVEVLGGTVKNGNATKYGGNLFTSGSNLLRVENAVISGGTGTGHGGNIFAENDLQILGSIISGGTTGGNGGNIYASRRSGAATLSKVTITDSLIGITTLENTEAFQKGGIANTGGNLHFNYADAVITGSRLLGGETVSHGGNAIINNSKLTLVDTEMTGGTTTSQGGALRVYKSTLIMQGGSISGGSAKKYSEYSNANISLSTESVFYFLGGTITASAEADRRGTGIDAGGGCTVYLGGNATVVDSSSLAGINVRETSVVRVCGGWTGNANIWLGKTYASGAELATTLLQVVTLDKNLNETVGGAFTGTLTQQGGLNLTADASGKFTVT